MNAFWAYFWPPFAAALVIGMIAGLIAFHAPRIRSKHSQAELDAALAKWRRRRSRAMIIGFIASFLPACVWHGPLGAADRFTAEVEQSARQVLAKNDAPAGVNARIHHDPLTRQLILAGPSNDFQQAEAARLLSQISGVSGASWVRTSGIPLIAEGAMSAVLGFLFGLLLAYLIELRRRHNAQWNW